MAHGDECNGPGYVRCIIADSVALRVPLQLSEADENHVCDGVGIPHEHRCIDSRVFYHEMSRFLGNVVCAGSMAVFWASALQCTGRRRQLGRFGTEYRMLRMNEFRQSLIGMTFRTMIWMMYRLLVWKTQNPPGGEGASPVCTGGP